MKIKVYFKQPYPVNDNAWKNIVFISIFIPVFLFMFQPFGITLFESKYKTLILLGYGFVTFVIAIINNYILPLLFKKAFLESNWTIGKNMISMLFTIFTIGLGNYIYTALVFSFIQFDIFGIISFQIITLMVALIPVGIITSLRYNSLMAKNLKLANELNQQLPTKNQIFNKQLVKLTSENGKDFLEVIANDILFIESSGNYIEVNYMKEGSPKNIFLRSTLKRADTILSSIPSMIKCHRAFYININQIDSIKGNSQGYRLLMKYVQKEIPVARNYAKTINEMLSPK